MKKMYLEPEAEVVELEMSVTLLSESITTDVTDEDYEHIGGQGDPGAIAE